jgi:hypothetical protein
MEETTITIPLAHFKQLLLAEKTLNALEEGGVDNWEWYSESLNAAGLFDEEEEDD